MVVPLLTGDKKVVHVHTQMQVQVQNEVLHEVLHHARGFTIKSIKW